MKEKQERKQKSVAKDLDVNEQELLNLIMEYVIGNGVTLDGFNAVVQVVKKEYGKVRL